MRGCRIIWRSITCHRFCDVLKEPIFHIVFRQSNLGACMIYILSRPVIIQNRRFLPIVCFMPSYIYMDTLTYRHHLYTGILVYLVFCIVHIIWHMKLEYVLVIDTYSSILLILSLLYSKLLGYIFGWKESCVVICCPAEHWYIAKLKNWFLYPEISCISNLTRMLFDLRSIRWLRWNDLRLSTGR